MAKYNKRIVQRITDLIKSDSYTIAEICAAAGIHKDTYYDWLKTKPDFSDAIKKAKEEFIQEGLVECERSLMKLIKGYTFDETKTIYIEKVEKDKKGNPVSKPKIKEQRINKKHFQPSLGAIIHFQTNHAPDTWKNRQSSEHTGKDGKDLFPEFDPTKLTTEQLKEFESLLKLGNND